MEGKKKTISCSYAVLVIILFAALAFVVDYAVIERKMNTCSCPKCESGVVNGESNTGITDNTVSDNNAVSSDSADAYKNFSNTLKNNRLSKFNSNNMAYQSVDSQIVGSYSVYLNENGSLYVKYYRSDLSSKYGDYKIADNVLSFYIILTGQNGGRTLYFINEDGTVGSADVEYGATESINIKTDLGYKSIVSVVAGGFGMQYSGVSGAIFIDIDGNMFIPNSNNF